MTSSPTNEDFVEALTDFVGASDFPCLGAKAAFNSGSYVVRGYDCLASPQATLGLASALEEFTESEMRRSSDYATFLAVFREPRDTSEKEFERLLWLQLQQLNQLDRRAGHGWDPNVSADPSDPHFSFSFAGQALYVVGLHAHSSRLSRRFRWPALIFNPHEQFERLRHDGKWRRMQETIRSRDVALQGDINPMLSDFGESSESRQYSGRAVEVDWQAPFASDKTSTVENQPSKCPFAHPES